MKDYFGTFVVELSVSTREFLEGCIKSCSSEGHVSSPAILFSLAFILPSNYPHEDDSTPELCLNYSQDHSLKWDFGWDFVLEAESQS